MNIIKNISIGTCLIDQCKFAKQRAINSSIKRITKRDNRRKVGFYSKFILNMSYLSDIDNIDNTNSLDAHTWSEDKLSEVTLYTDKSRNWSNSYFKDVKFHR